ncbi:MAG: hypothetical protein N3A01_02890 [Bacteroidales bacterium]|nr:hypothetical protein [Bacteroidales bacterium]
MIYKFRATIDEDKEFMMDIEIKDNSTFYDFHTFIQEELEYDKSYLASFYIASHSWRPLIEIPQIIINPDSEKKVCTMENAILKDYIKDAHQKILYLFDNIYNRYLKLELIETKDENPDLYYPICTNFKGKIPPQIGPVYTENENDDINFSKSAYFTRIIENDIEDDINIAISDSLSMPDVSDDLILEEDIQSTASDISQNEIDDEEAETIITSLPEDYLDDEAFDEFITKRRATNRVDKRKLTKETLQQKPESNQKTNSKAKTKSEKKLQKANKTTGKIKGQKEKLNKDANESSKTKAKPLKEAKTLDKTTKKTPDNIKNKSKSDSIKSAEDSRKKIKIKENKQKKSLLPKKETSSSKTVNEETKKNNKTKSKESGKKKK